MKFPHTHFRKGKRLRIKLRDGTVIVSRFMERIARAIVVENDSGVRQEIPTRLLAHCGHFNAALHARNTDQTEAARDD